LDSIFQKSILLLERNQAIFKTRGGTMCPKDDTIREAVQEFVTAEKLFTSVDIGNAIKKTTLKMDIRNRDVRDWLRSNIGKDSMLQDYVSEPIDVNGGNRVAMLYRPHWKDAGDYLDRDQRAFSPSDLSALSPASASPSPISSSTATAVLSKPGTAGSASVVSTDTDRKDDSQLPLPDLLDDGTHPNISGTGVRLVRKSRYVRRIQIPGDITKAIGWKPGQTVDPTKIKIHSGKLNPNLKVWYDGRVSIPRKVVGYGVDPINIILKGDEIFFEKA